MAYFLNAIVIKEPYEKMEMLDFGMLVKVFLNNTTKLDIKNIDYQEYKEHMKSQDIPRAVLVPSLKKKGIKYRVNIGDTVRESELFADRTYGFWEMHKIDNTTVYLLGLNRKMYNDQPQLFGLSEAIAIHISKTYDIDPMVFMSDGSSRSANSFVYYHSGRPTVRFDGKDCFTHVRDQYKIDVNMLLEGIYKNEDALLAVLDLRTTEDCLRQYKDLSIAIEQNEKIEFKESADEATKAIMKTIDKESKKKALEKYKTFVEDVKKDRDSIVAARKKAQSTGNRDLVKKLTDDLKSLNSIIEASDEKKLYMSIRRQVETDRTMFMEQVGYVKALLNQRNYALTLLAGDPSCKVTYFRLTPQS